MGIDPGYDRVGWCIGKMFDGNFSVEAYGSVLTDKHRELIERYRSIDTRLQEIISQYHPVECAIESLFFSKNQKTAMHVSEARGVILSTLFRNHIQCFEYTPLQIKQAVTGNGRADKNAVDRMLRMQLGTQVKEQKILDDVMDAIATTVTHAASRRTNLL